MQSVRRDPDQNRKPEVNKTLFVVLTGLPASGKTTLGKQLATRLGIAFLDKDVFLEQLFEDHAVGTEETRKILSRRSDKLFIEAALAQDAAVLVSHWRPASMDTQSGTPFGWLEHTNHRIIEVHCHCSPETSARRFVARQRHPGHADSKRAPDQILAWLKSYADHLPLNLGYTLTVDTSSPSSPDSVAESVRLLLAD